MATLSMPAMSIQPGLNALSQGLQMGRDRRNQNAFEQAMQSGDSAGIQNALARINPAAALNYGQQQTENQAAAAKVDRDKALQTIKWGAGMLVSAPDDASRAQIWSQVGPQIRALGGVFASVPDQYDPSVLAGANSILERFPKDSEGFTLGEGQVRFGPDGRQLAQGPAKTPDLPSAVREYEYARNQGYKGTFQDFQVEQRKAGAASNTVTFGSPVAGVDAQGNPVYFQPSKDGGAPAIVPGVRPAPNKAEQPTESERTAAFLYDRVKRAQADIERVTKESPDSARPEFAGAIAGAIGGETARNFANSEARQRIEAAQLDALDAALTLATGAAYTREQLEGTRRSYFPQIGDNPATAAEKNQRFSDLVKSAEVKAGRALPKNEIPSAGAGNGPAVGTVKGGYRFKGGNPADKASWEKV